MIGNSHSLSYPLLPPQSTGNLFPVPVLNRNYRTPDGEELNYNKRELQELDDQYTRRFFLFDTVRHGARESQDLSTTLD